MSVLDDNIKQLEGYLARFKDTGILNRIAGQDVVGSQGAFQTISPVDKSGLIKSFSLAETLPDT